MIKERPILYSTPMAQAKVERRKTHTRRILKEQPDNDCYYQMELGFLESTYGVLINYNGGDNDPFVPCPYGKPGDILWGKEQHYDYGHWHYTGETTKTGKRKKEFTSLVDSSQIRFYENPPDVTLSNKTLSMPGWFKRNSLFMPYRYARIYDRITEIRVERLQDISEEDAIAEGIDIFLQCRTDDNLCFFYPDRDIPLSGIDNGCLSVDVYKSLWESINGPGSWDLNPFCWVIVTECLSTTGRPAELNKPIALTSI